MSGDYKIKIFSNNNLIIFGDSCTRYNRKCLSYQVLPIYRFLLYVLAQKEHVCVS